MAGVRVPLAFVFPACAVMQVARVLYAFLGRYQVDGDNLVIDRRCR
ncbi:MAG: hypothetical protein M3326_14270 [Actinomycetota bacterium]|nr:hypothetical protein [Actinomycetota bacterium]